MAREVTLRIGSRLENVALLGVALNGICREAGLDEREAYNVELAVVEAVSNSVRHAYRGEDGHEVEARVAVRRDQIEIRILDDGLPVPEERRRPKAPEVDPQNPGTLSEGGRGTFLIHTLMDRVAYGTEGGRNLLLLVKAIPGTHS